MTIVDFFFLELAEFVNWLTATEFYRENPEVGKYVKAVKNIRQIKRYIKSDRYLEKPFNNKVAKINNMD